MAKEQKTVESFFSEQVVVSKPEWNNIILHDSYAVSFGILSEKIIIITPIGDCKEQGIVLLLKKLEMILAQRNLLAEKLFYIWDYAKVIGLPSLSARKEFTKYFVKCRDENRILGLFGCNTPLIIRFIGNTTAKIYKPSFPVDFSLNYETALKKALVVLQKNNSEE